jgi:hypothetical protein
MSIKTEAVGKVNHLSTWRDANKDKKSLKNLLID